MKTIQELSAWLQGTMLLQHLNEIRDHEYFELGVTLITFGEYWMPYVLEKINKMNQWQADLLRRRQRTLVLRLSPYEELAGQTVPVKENTAVADTYEEEPMIKLEEEDTEEILDNLDVPDAPGTPNTPTSTPLPDTPDDLENSDILDISDSSAGTSQSDESPLDHKANQSRRTNRAMPPRGGLERPRSILESLGWVKVAGSEHEMESGIDGDMARHK